MPLRYRFVMMVALLLAAVTGAAQAQAPAPAPGSAPSAGSIYIVTYFEVGAAGASTTVGLLRQFAAATRKANGNAGFVALQETTRAGRFAMVEVWRDKPALDAHAAAVSGLRDKLQPLFASPLDIRTNSGLAVAPPLLTPDAQLRFVVSPANEVRAEDAATGAVRWTLGAPFLAGAATLHWRLLLTPDGASVYVQSLSDEPRLTYLGTRRIDARTGGEQANDYKFEIYWYENVVLWTALKTTGELLMAVKRPADAGGGYWVRALDPLTLKMRTDIPQPGPPAIPGQ